MSRNRRKFLKILIRIKLNQPVSLIGIYHTYYVIATIHAFINIFFAVELIYLPV